MKQNQRKKSSLANSGLCAINSSEALPLADSEENPQRDFLNVQLTFLYF